MVSSRERVNLILNHKEADRVPLDLGGSGTTGMHVDSVYLLRQALRLDPPGTPVKVIDPFQMLGEIALEDAGPVVPIAGVAVHLTRSPGAIRSRAPKPGEHNDDVYGGLLGYRSDQIAALQAAGVI